MGRRSHNPLGVGMRGTRPPGEDIWQVESILDRYEAGGESLIAVLQDLQAEYRYLPRDILVLVSGKLGMPLSQVYSVATFFNAFSLTPRGQYTISVCLGTACHVQGGQRILAKLERDLSIREGETTEDRNFSLEAVRCLGCCGLAPVVTVGDDLYGKVSQAKLTKIVAKYRTQGE